MIPRKSSCAGVDRPVLAAATRGGDEVHHPAGAVARDRESYGTVPVS